MNRNGLISLQELVRTMPKLLAELSIVNENSPCDYLGGVTERATCTAGEGGQGQPTCRGALEL